MDEDGKGEGEVIIYRTDDGADELRLRLADGTVWLTQAEIATLFESTKQNISHHIREVLADGEQAEAATVKDYLTVQTEGKRQTLKWRRVQGRRIRRHCDRAVGANENK